MYQLATAAGMLSAELSKTKDDVLLMTYRFPSMRAMTSFTEHPAHRAVQNRGEEFFATLHTQVCMLVRESEFQPQGAATARRVSPEPPGGATE